jgi:hypothetical protein
LPDPGGYNALNWISEDGSCAIFRRRLLSSKEKRIWVIRAGKTRENGNIRKRRCALPRRNAD